MEINARRMKDAQGNEGVFLTLAEYERVLDEIEELEDALDFDAAMASEEVPIRQYHSRGAVDRT